MKSFLDTPRVAAELAWEKENFGIGTLGRIARRVQEWLCLHGFRVVVDADYGPATAAAVRAFQDARDLRITGTATPETLTALTLPLRMAFGFEGTFASLRSAILGVAEAHLKWHPREVGGDNRGPWVRAYCAGDGPSWRWCAGCNTTIVQQAAAMIGQSSPIPFTLSCDDLAASARKSGRLFNAGAQARPGDLFLCLNPRNLADRIHTGIVRLPQRESFLTFEGNTNDDGSPNGYEFCARTRAYGRLIEFVRMG